MMVPPKPKRRRVLIAFVVMIVAAIITGVAAFLIVYTNRSREAAENTNRQRDGGVRADANNPNRQTPTPTPPSTTNAATPPPAPSPEEEFTANIGGVNYRLMEARFAGDELHFTFVANNTQAKKQVCVASQSSLIDGEGNPHQSNYRMLSDSRTSNSCLYIELPNLVPVRFVIIFNGISPKTVQIPILTLHLGNEGSAEMRKIPIPYQRRTQ